jgi:hypothetical protein
MDLQDPSPLLKKEEVSLHFSVYPSELQLIT